MAKVPASEPSRNALKRMLSNVDGSLDLSGLVRQSARLMVEKAAGDRGHRAAGAWVLRAWRAGGERC